MSQGGTFALCSLPEPSGFRGLFGKRSYHAAAYVTAQLLKQAERSGPGLQLSVHVLKIRDVAQQAAYWLTLDITFRAASLECRWDPPLQ